MGARLIAVWIVLAMALAGPLQPLAEAQQAGQASAAKKTDVYDVGAGAMNVVAVPLKGVTCLLGGLAGLAILVVTFGNEHRGSSAAVREGCDLNWIITGDDIRPARGSEARLHDWDAYDGGER